MKELILKHMQNRQSSWSLGSLRAGQFHGQAAHQEREVPAP
ncbi:hypothetical protein [Alkalimarinus coralli]|nr:hypothetical protein [Alkalimarinus coralli]